jgi:dsDNA-binding SOS-regulon protein
MAVVKYVISRVHEELEEWVVTCKKECDNDDELLRDIISTESRLGKVAFSNFVFFDTEKEVTCFLLKWTGR